MPDPQFEATQDREVRNVGCFGATMTAVLIALVVLIIGVGLVFTFLSGCCTSLSNYGSSSNQRAPEVDLAPYLWPVGIGAAVMWVVLAIVIFVIRKRRRP